MKVSVVVPVFNTGEHLAKCVESVLGQTLDDYEVIFADDGSDDGTEKLLDALAAEHDRVRVVHLRPSGGPGGPRNTGIDEAHGDYVYFLDDDDWLGPEALERMHAMAVRNDADIVIGKMVGHGRAVPRAMFRKSRDRADVLKDALYGILTPHKLFRRSFLDEHRIRFPEGPVRLEDHRFVLKAYFRARTISVLADYPCCHWVRRPGSYSRSRPDPAHYYGALREVLDIVDEHVEPGPDRERYYVHWYRGKILKRLGEKSFLEAPPEYRRVVYDEARRVVVERFGESVDRRLPFRMRVRAALLRADAYDDLFRLVEAERDVAIETALDGMRWDDARLVVRFTARLVDADGTPFVVRDGRWEPPVPLPISGGLLDATGEHRRLDLYVRRREDAADHLLPVTVIASEVFAMSGEAVIDPNADPALAPGVWDFVARLDTGGWICERRLEGGARIARRGRLMPYRTENGKLSVRVLASEDERARPEGPLLRRALKKIPGARRAVRRLRA
ncbi:glycosyltransferase family 2 protein [Actinoallomurus sp. CA-150999]|uniref:glycosyltransferase family 2 protein n=1 Tax=Actinoallomurus sp. CA-150999 TaxID=3239887 RepID=UPI003D8F5873